MDLSLPRGIRDIEPEEYETHQRIRTVFNELARIYSFQLMEPGPIESLSLLRAKSGSAVDEQIYSFKDKAGRDIGLRFDLTIGLTRFVAGRRGKKPPIKLASYGGVWRYDEPQHARYRWFHQWDIEVFGDPSVEADAEIMDFSYNFFRKVGLEDVSVQVGDRRVVEDYIRSSLGVRSEEKVTHMMRALDKVAKKTDQELTKEYEAKGIMGKEIKELLDFGRTKDSPDKVLDKLGQLGLQTTDLVELRDSLKLRGIRNVEYNLSIVRGIDYYTAIVFEVVDNTRRDLGSLCGGGRYDVLPRLFGRPDLAATGAAGGIERIALSLPKMDKVALSSVYVAHTDQELMKNALEMLAALRRAGVRADAGTKGKKLSKQLEEASEKGFRWAVIVARKEISSGRVVLKDMKERKEESIPLEDVVPKMVECD